MIGSSAESSSIPCEDSHVAGAAGFAVLPLAFGHVATSPPRLALIRIRQQGDAPLAVPAQLGVVPHRSKYRSFPRLYPSTL